MLYYYYNPVTCVQNVKDRKAHNFHRPRKFLKDGSASES